MKKTYYIDPVDLSCCIVEMQANNCMSEKFCDYLMEVEKRVLNFPRFRGYNDQIKEDMVSFDQYRWAVSGWKSIKANRNPFAYLTSGISLNFLYSLKKSFETQNKYIEYCKQVCQEAGVDYNFLKSYLEGESEGDDDND